MVWFLFTGVYLRHTEQQPKEHTDTGLE